jgi:methionyl-tRNA synthetase
MCLKYFDGRLTGAASVDATRWREGLDLDEMLSSLRAQIGLFEFSSALQRIWRDVVDRANRYIQETQPFKLAKTNPDECLAVLINLSDWLRVTAILIKPFLPRTAETFYRAFNFGEAKAWAHVNYADAIAPLSVLELRVTAPITGGKPAPLFPKVEVL